MLGGPTGLGGKIIYIEPALVNYIEIAGGRSITSNLHQGASVCVSVLTGYGADVFRRCPDLVPLMSGTAPLAQWGAW